MNQELRHVLAPELLRQLAARPLDAGYTQQVVVMGRTVTVHELTTAEVRRWFMELSQEGSGFDLVTETLIPGGLPAHHRPHERCHHGGAGRVYRLAASGVGHRLPRGQPPFFSDGGDPDGGLPGGDHLGGLAAARRQLERSACALARAGHSQVWGYPWAIFLAALELEHSIAAR